MHLRSLQQITIPRSKQARPSAQSQEQAARFAINTAQPQGLIEANPTLATGQAHKHQQTATGLLRPTGTATARRASKNTHKSAQQVPDKTQ